MSKDFFIEVPLYSRPVEYLAKINRTEDIGIMVYGGIPNSPFNGGRMNSALDGLRLWGRRGFSLSPQQLEYATAKFYKTVSQINGQGMAFCAVSTNIFVSPEELNAPNLNPFQWLVESSQKYGVKNGVIINNGLLEEHLRRKYGNSLVYISSCTKYVSKHKMLSPKDTMEMYKKDTAKYDFVVLTPQDSRREKLIRNMVGENKNKIIAIANSYCSNNCNSYHHYEYLSKQNKISLLRGAVNRQAVSWAVKFLTHTLNCSVYWHAFFPVEVEKIAAMQLEAGVVNFKLGRGLGAEKFEKLVELIRKFKENRLVGDAT